MKANYSKENLESIVKDSYSIAEVARKLGLVDKGSTFKTIKKYITKYNLDTSHFTGLAWRKGKKDTYVNKLDDILKDGINYGSNRLLTRLVKAGLKQYECEKCKISSWQGNAITLELHHINGDHYDNTINNLQILCPNCHSQTETYRSRTHTKKKIDRITTLINEEKECPICHKKFKGQRSTTKFCSRECYVKSVKKINGMSEAQ